MSLLARLRLQKPIALELNLRCDAGQCVALVGASGAGKSTALRALAGLISSEGELSVAGQSWQGLPTHRRAVGLVAQQFNLLPHLTALENIAMGIVGEKSQRLALAQQWLERVNLNGLAARYPGQLSGGQQQRVAIARALARQPQLLLLDEPFSSVDAATRQRLYEELMILRKTIACPTVLVTHDVKEAAMLADEIAVISQGRVLTQGAAQHLLTNPPSAQVARVLGWRNVIPITPWCSIAAWQTLIAPTLQMSQPRKQYDYVLVAHRHVKISPPDTGIGEMGRVRGVLQLPHQAWGHVEVGGVHLWGLLAAQFAPEIDQACCVTVPEHAVQCVSAD